MNKQKMTIVIEYDEDESHVGDFINEFMFEGYSMETSSKNLKNTALLSVVKGDKLNEAN